MIIIDFCLSLFKIQDAASKGSNQFDDATGGEGSSEPLRNGTDFRTQTQGVEGAHESLVYTYLFDSIMALW